MPQLWRPHEKDPRENHPCHWPQRQRSFKSSVRQRREFKSSKRSYSSNERLLYLSPRITWFTRVSPIEVLSTLMCSSMGVFSIGFLASGGKWRDRSVDFGILFAGPLGLYTCPTFPMNSKALYISVTLLQIGTRDSAWSRVIKKKLSFVYLSFRWINTAPKNIFKLAFCPKQELSNN